MSEAPEEFRDSELKAAIVRLRGGHRVRPDLREQILQRLEEQRAQIARDENGEPADATDAAEGGAVVAGDEIPGDEIPGEEIPGDEIPGEEIPGEEIPGDEIPTEITDEPDFASNPVPEVQATPEAQPAPTMRLAADAKDFPTAAQEPERVKHAGGGFRLPHWIAAAAVLLIVVGLSAGYWRHVKHEEEEREEYLAANRTLLEAMIAAKEQPTAAVNSVAASVSDPAAVATEMQGKLGRAVPIVKLAGWKLDSAGITQVAGVQAGQWRMSKGKRTLTVLSLPRDAFKGEEGYDEYDFVLDNHAIAGYVKDGGIHCIVGDASMTGTESIALREELRRG